MKCNIFCVYDETSKHCYRVIRVWELPLKALPIEARLITNHIELLIHQRIITTLLIAKEEFTVNEICNILEKSNSPASVIKQISDEFSEDYSSDE